jgi:hypothetical protein
VTDPRYRPQSGLEEIRPFPRLEPIYLGSSLLFKETFAFSKIVLGEIFRWFRNSEIVGSNSQKWEARLASVAGERATLGLIVGSILGLTGALPFCRIYSRK